MVIAVALSLLAAPLHRVLEHNHDEAHASQTHHCPVCALAKGQLDTPDFSPSTVVFERGEIELAIVEISSTTASTFGLLPPGRAPPVSVIPS